MHTIIQGGTSLVFGKPLFCPLPKRARFDENGENDEIAFASENDENDENDANDENDENDENNENDTQAKAWFRKRPGLFFPELS